MTLYLTLGHRIRKSLIYILLQSMATHHMQSFKTIAKKLWVLARAKV